MYDLLGECGAGSRECGITGCRFGPTVSILLPHPLQPRCSSSTYFIPPFVIGKLTSKYGCTCAAAALPLVKLYSVLLADVSEIGACLHVLG